MDMIVGFKAEAPRICTLRYSRFNIKANKSLGLLDVRGVEIISAMESTMDRLVNRCRISVLLSLALLQVLLSIYQVI